MTSSIYNGTVIHKRFKPKTHFFKYSVFSLLIDLSELDEIDKNIKFYANYYKKYNEYLSNNTLNSFTKDILNHNF